MPDIDWTRKIRCQKNRPFLAGPRKKIRPMPEIGGPSSRALAVDSTRLDSTRVCNDSFAITTRAFVFFSRNPLLPYEYIANNGYIRYLTKFGGAESLDDMLATKPSEKYHTTARSRSRAEELKGASVT